MDLFIYIDCTLTPWHLVCTSVSFERGQNESVPKSSHSQLSRYSVFKLRPTTRDIKEEFPHGTTTLQNTTKVHRC